MKVNIEEAASLISDTEEILDSIKEYFLTSDDTQLDGPIYILPDGISVSPMPKDYSGKGINHADFENYLHGIGLSDRFGNLTGDASPTLSSIGAIRCNDIEEENNYIELSPKRPTSSQFSALETWLDHNKYNQVAVCTPNMSDFVIYDLDDVDYIINRIKRYYSSGTLYEHNKKAIIKMNSGNIIKEALTISTDLNPKIWDEDHNLKEEVRDKILEIVEEFKNNLEENNIPLYIADVRLLGSQASYNYTDHSDLDVHIVSNFGLVDASPEILQAAYNAAKANFNKNYDISIKGINVEMYVEDINTVTISNGIYSVLNDAWIKFPEKLDPELMKRDISPEDAQVWIDNINDAITSEDLDNIESIINALYLRRKDGLATDNREFSKGNLLFKYIRDLGLLDELKDARLLIKSKELSLENFNNREEV